jgi:hypothetical protein
MKASDDDRSDLLGGILRKARFSTFTPGFYTALNRPSTPLDDLPFIRE